MLRLACLTLATACTARGPCMELPTEPPTCTDHPGLCNLPIARVDVREPDRARAYDVVFISEGFTASELPEYRRRVAALVDELGDDDRGIVAMRPDAFNFERIDLASATSDVDNDDRADTALAGCVAGDTVSSRAFERTGFALVELVLAQTAPYADAAIVVVNSDDGYAWTEGRHVMLPHHASERTLTHELGHALFELADEYADTFACYLDRYPDEHEPLEANVTLDPSGAKWAGLVDGAEPGGFRYGDCIYHPTDACRMKVDDTPDFCPVCRDEIRRAIAAHVDGAQDGPPVLHLGVTGTSALLQVVDHNPPVACAVRYDDQELVEATHAQVRTQWFFSVHPGPGHHVVAVTCNDALGEQATTFVSVDR